MKWIKAIGFIALTALAWGAAVDVLELGGMVGFLGGLPVGFAAMLWASSHWDLV